MTDEAQAQLIEFSHQLVREAEKPATETQVENLRRILAAAVATLGEPAAAISPAAIASTP